MNHDQDLANQIREKIEELNNLTDAAKKEGVRVSATFKNKSVDSKESYAANLDELNIISVECYKTINL